jgi:HD-GYP domain-containing protein (c-di-GMP phosphodiesterase class II)
MAESNSVFVDIAELRIGMFVYLELGWMSHPFPASSFKISTDRQLQTIRSLGLTRIRWSAEKSDPDPVALERAADPAQPSVPSQDTRLAVENALLLARRREQLSAQRRSFAQCEEKFNQATAVCVQVMGCASSQPELARDKSQALVTDMMEQMLGQGESMIHLLSDGSGERAALHPVNVSVMSLLLGKAMGLPASQLQALGMAALLHDLGKAQLPERVRWRDPSFSAMEDKIHQEHVALSVTAAQRLGLATPILLGIAQHHEMVDGSGFPLGLKGESMTVPARILALVNRYDNLCNPPNASLALTPHEALAQIFAQAKARFDATSLNAFIRLMGIYPPGSVVQLVDDRFALVLSVNSSRPLRPQVIVHDPAVPRDEALIVNLEEHPLLGIRRSLKPVHLPQAALNYLSPRKRVSYFFEQVAPFGAEAIVE